MNEEQAEKIIFHLSEINIKTDKMISLLKVFADKVDKL